MLRISAAMTRMQRWDEQLCVAMNRAIRYGAVLPLFRAISWLGNGIFWYSLMLSMLLHDGADGVPALLHMMIVGVACTALYKLLKQRTLRPRPYQALQAVAPGASALDAFSFPSGHMLHAVAFSMVAIAYYPMLAVPLAFFCLLTAASRVVLGLHYPSDVLAGAAIGALIAGLSLRV